MHFLLPLAALASVVSAETGLAAWLRYAPYPGAAQHISGLPKSIVSLNATRESPVFTAGTEIREALHQIFNVTVKVDHPPSKSYANSSAVVVGTVAQYEQAFGSITPDQALIADGYWLDTTGSVIKIVGENERGALYGAFAYLSMVAQGNFCR
jgi:alpha-glucuronidase